MMTKKLAAPTLYRRSDHSPNAHPSTESFGFRRPGLATMDGQKNDKWREQPQLGRG